MDVSMIRRPQDWPFPIPQITAESIDELIDALHRDVSDSTLSIYYDAVGGEAWIGGVISRRMS